MEENNNTKTFDNNVVKGTNGWAIAGFVSSFFTTLIGLILSLIGLIVGCKYEWRHSGKGFAIAGLIISGFKLIITVTLIIIISTLLNKYNFIDCFDAENCVEQDDGTYICEKDSEMLTCLFNINELDDVNNYEFEWDEEELLGGLEDSLDLDLDTDLNLMKSGYQDYDEAINYIINNSSKVTYLYTENGDIKPLDDTSKSFVISALSTQNPEGLYTGDIIESQKKLIISFINNDNEEIDITVLENDGFNTVSIYNNKLDKFNTYKLGTLINIFDYINNNYLMLVFYMFICYTINIIGKSIDETNSILDNFFIFLTMYRNFNFLFLCP